MRPLNLLGRCFGTLIVTARESNDAHGSTRWRVRCQKDGNEIVALAGNLTRGRTTTCGKHAGKRATTGPENWNYKHGQSSYKDRRASRTYKTWESMLRRCLNPKDKDYENYGGRGITICARWQEGFSNFLADMGERPEGKTLDRKEVNGNYEPGNCKWSDPQEQAKNRRAYKALDKFSDEELLAEVRRRGLDMRSEDRSLPDIMLTI